MKRKLLILTISLLLLSMVFSACSGDKAITGLKITEGLAYTVEVGSTFDTSKVVAEVSYNDNTTVTVTAADLTFSTIDTSKAGKQQLTITYQDFSITVEITVKKPEAKAAELVSIAIVQNFKTELFLGEGFDTSAITAIANYDDGSQKTIANGDLTISALDLTTVGEKTLTVTYEGKTATATIKVKAIELTEIKIDPLSIDYNAETLDVAAIKVTAIYNNGTRATKTAADGVTFTQNNADNTLTASWNGKTHTITLTPPVLTGIRIDSYNVKGYQGVAYQTTVTASAIYDNGGEATIAATELSVSAIDTATAGDKTITVTWNGLSATATVQVVGVKSIAFNDNTLPVVKEISRLGTLNTAGIAINVTYEDGQQVLGLTSANGVTFNNLDTSEVGESTLTATYFGKSVDVIFNVVSYEIWGVALPDGIATYQDKANTSFYTSDDTYAVGDDNPFRFELSLLCWDANAEELLLKDDVIYASKSKVFRVIGNREYQLVGAELASYVTIDENAHTFDFTDKAVGGKFRIETAPANDLAVDEAECTAKLTLRVVDAYNIYDAKELNLISNYKGDNLYNDMQTYGSYLAYVSQYTAVTNFLTKHGIDPTPRDTMAGVVLHDTLHVTPNDIPEEYLFKKSATDVGYFFDQLSIFHHVVSDDHPTFTMYGNYNTLYSYTLPIIVGAGVANNGTGADAASSSDLLYFSVDSGMLDAQKTAYDGTKYNSRVENLFMVGDDAHDTTATNGEKHMRSLRGIRTSFHTVDIDNVRVQKYLISVVADMDYQTVNITDCQFFNGWMNHLYAWNHNRISESYDKSGTAATITYHQPITINIKNSLLAKCGGPVIISDYAEDDDDNVEYYYNDVCAVNIHADKDTEIYTYVTGRESWFVTFNFTDLATGMLGMSRPIEDFAKSHNKTASLTSLNNEGYSERSANLVMVNRGNRGTFVHEGNGSLSMDPASNPGFAQAVGEWDLMEAYGFQQVPPVIQAGGATAFIAPESENSPYYKLYNSVLLGQLSSDARLADGTYANLYTRAILPVGAATVKMDIGIVCGYYH